jgi:hypothetical protein
MHFCSLLTEEQLIGCYAAVVVGRERKQTQDQLSTQETKNCWKTTF